MGGTTNDGVFARSSSPLKRPASSMEQDHDSSVEMHDVDATGSSPSTSATSLTPDSSNPDPSVSPQRTDKNDDVDTIMGSQSTNVSSPSSAAPPLAEQIQTIESQVQAFNAQELEVGTVAYLVSRKWLSKAQALGASADAAPVASSPGPVDNSDIIKYVVRNIDDEMAVRLIPGAGQEDFEFFPKEAWEQLVAWHGLAKSQLPITRVAHNTAPSPANPNIQFEVHPPVFTLYRLHTPSSGYSPEKEGATDQLPVPQFMCASNTKVNTFLKKAKTLLHIPMARKVRVWRIPQKLPAGHGGAAEASPEVLGPNMVVPVADFRKLENNTEREHIDMIADRTNDENYNGHQNLAFASLTVDQAIVLDENIENNKYISSVHEKNKGKAAVSAKQSPSASPMTSLVLANSSASRSSSAASNGKSANSAVRRDSSNTIVPATRSRLRTKSGRTAGCVGLGNLGNTCYMNSALQCVRSVEELTKYFLVKENENETNYDNPLGHHGNVANAYAGLLAEIWRDNAPSSVAPRQFKSTIGRYAPAFSGYGQQDSQEFLGFLLDGLQEDLSRVKKKPYIPKPDSTDDMINNPAAIREMADQVWEITKRRDDSVIADLFTGMYKSTLVCPTCAKVSITFDPFTNLTLPLPIQNIWSKTITYMPLNDRMVKMDVELPKSSTFDALKKFVSVRTGVPVGRLVVAEDTSGAIYHVFGDSESIAETGQNEDIRVYEVETVPSNNTNGKLPRNKFRSMLDPCVPSKPKQPLWKHAMADHLLVPVSHRLAPGADPRYFRNGLCPAHFIVVNREEAKSEDVIRRKILEKLATFSTWTEFAKADSMEDNASPKSVTDKSVEGEDDMVDVTMNDAAANVPADSLSPGHGPKPLREFNHHRPKWVTNPDSFLAGELQNLFSMGYYDSNGSSYNSSSSNIIPSKYGIDRGEYPRLSSRIPAPPTPEPASPDTMASDDGNETTSQDELVPTDGDSPSRSPSASSPITRMTEESDEDDRPIRPRVRALKTVPGPAGRRRHLKSHHKYGAKNGKRAQQFAKKEAVSGVSGVSGVRSPTSVSDVEDEVPKKAPSIKDSASEAEPLIRLGEGIFVDWSTGSYDVVFGKTELTDDLRGAKTFEDDEMETLADPALREKRRDRIGRKKRGLTLDECLDEFEREEVLSENDMWYCPRCKEHRRASKKFDLWKTPDILVVHLKRFSSSGYRRDKLDMRVDFPVEGLDITKRVLDRQSGKTEIYDLIAVDDHWGGLGGGHYTAFARNFLDGAWYEYNDSSVSRVSDPARVVSSASYLLFYRRRSDTPLGGPRFKEIDDKFHSRFLGGDESDGSSRKSSVGGGFRAGSKKQRNAAESRGSKNNSSDEDQDAFADADPDAAHVFDDDNGEGLAPDMESDVWGSPSTSSRGFGGDSAAAPGADITSTYKQSWGFDDAVAGASLGGAGTGSGRGIAARGSSPDFDMAEVDGDEPVPDCDQLLDDPLEMLRGGKIPHNPTFFANLDASLVRSVEDDDSDSACAVTEIRLGGDDEDEDEGMGQ